MPSSQPIDIPDAKKRNKKKKRCRATDSFSGRFEGERCGGSWVWAALSAVAQGLGVLNLEKLRGREMHSTTAGFGWGAVVIPCRGVCTEHWAFAACTGLSQKFAQE